MGGTPLMWNTGHSLIKSKMKETGAPLAGEMSGHIFFKHEWYGFDNALYAAVRLIRAVSSSGQSLTELKSAMPVSVATPELRFQVDESRKFAVVGEVAERLAARRRRGQQDRRRCVKTPTAGGSWRIEHAGRPRCPCRIHRPARPRPADGDDQRTTRGQRHRRRAGRPLRQYRPATPP